LSRLVQVLRELEDERAKCTRLQTEHDLQQAQFRSTLNTVHTLFGVDFNLDSFELIDPSLTPLDGDTSVGVLGDDSDAAQQHSGKVTPALSDTSSFARSALPSPMVDVRIDSTYGGLNEDNDHAPSPLRNDIGTGRARQVRFADEKDIGHDLDSARSPSGSTSESNAVVDLGFVRSSHQRMQRLVGTVTARFAHVAQLLDQMAASASVAPVKGSQVSVSSTGDGANHLDLTTNATGTETEEHASSNSSAGSKVRRALSFEADDGSQAQQRTTATVETESKSRSASQTDGANACVTALRADFTLLQVRNFW